MIQQILQLTLQDGARGKNAISRTISTAPKRARGTNHAQEQLLIFTASKFRASVRDGYSLTREI
jgi:hypothetical protein